MDDNDDNIDGEENMNEIDDYNYKMKKMLAQ